MQWDRALQRYSVGSGEKYDFLKNCYAVLIEKLAWNDAQRVAAGIEIEAGI